MITTAVPKTVIVPFFKLLGPAWTRAFRCLWMLEELGLPYENDGTARPGSSGVKQFHASGKVPVLLQYDHTPYNNNNNNPNTSVEQQQAQPSFILSESVAINTYLGDAFGGDDDRPDRLVPKAIQARAKYDETVLCILSELDAQGVWMHTKHDPSSHAAKFYGSLPAAVTAAQQQFTRFHTILAQPLLLTTTTTTPNNINNDNQNQQLYLQPYLLGEHFTAADILYVSCLDWAQSIGWLNTKTTASSSNNNNNDNHQTLAVAVESYLNRCRSRPAYQRAHSLRKQSMQQQSSSLSKL